MRRIARLAERARRRRERPGDCCAAEKHDELATRHSVTSSTRPGIRDFAERALWNADWYGAALLRLDVGRSDDLRPFCGVACYKFREGGGRICELCAT